MTPMQTVNTQRKALSISCKLSASVYALYCQGSTVVCAARHAVAWIAVSVYSEGYMLVCTYVRRLALLEAATRVLLYQPQSTGPKPNNPLEAAQMAVRGDTHTHAHHTHTHPHPLVRVKATQDCNHARSWAQGTPCTRLMHANERVYVCAFVLTYRLSRVPPPPPARPLPLLLVSVPQMSQR